MHPPLREQPYTAGQRPTLTQIGIDKDGNPLFKYADPTPVYQPAPIQPHRPLGPYIAAAAVGGPIVIFLALGLAVLAIAVAISAVALTGSLLILRSMWRDYQRDRDRES